MSRPLHRRLEALEAAHGSDEYDWSAWSDAELEAMLKEAGIEPLPQQGNGSHGAMPFAILCDCASCKAVRP